MISCFSLVDVTLSPESALLFTKKILEKRTYLLKAFVVGDKEIGLVVVRCCSLDCIRCP